MQSNKNDIAAQAEPAYTIWFAGETRQGTAEDLLEGIRHDAAHGSAEIRKLTTEKYAALIVSDAGFFLPRELLGFLRTQRYPTEFDRALRYLSEMPNSGVRILQSDE